MIHSGLPTAFWAEAVRNIVWVYNRTTHKGAPGEKTPYEAWYGHKPDVSMAKVWGTMVCVKFTPREMQEVGKLNPRGHMCVVLGVDEETKAWRLLDPNIMKVRISKNVHFLENQTWKQWAVDGKGGMVGVSSPESVITALPPCHS